MNLFSPKNVLKIFKYNYHHILFDRLISLVGRVFTNGLGDLGSIPGRVTPKTLKVVLDTYLLNTQQYKVCIKDKVEQSWERSSPPLHFGVVAIEKGAFGSPSTSVTNCTLLTSLIFPSFLPTPGDLA